jgi:hypothetical protein
MNEPDVTLTDYVIAFECFTFCSLLFKQYGFQSPSKWFALFFASIGLAAFAGGTVHGFFPAHETFMHDTFWFVSMASIGLMALSGWIIGAFLLRLSNKAIAIIKAMAGFGFAVYILYLLLVSQEFLIAILNYLPAAVFLLSVFIYRYFKEKTMPTILGIVAMLLTFLSSFVQQAQIIVHPVYFDHNALYHLIQIVALFLLFLSAKYFIETTENSYVKSS